MSLPQFMLSMLTLTMIVVAMAQFAEFRRKRGIARDVAAVMVLVALGCATLFGLFAMGVFS